MFWKSGKVGLVANLPLPRASPPLPSSARRAAPSAASAKTAVASAASASLGEALFPSSPSPLLSPSFIDALCLSRLPQEEAQAWGGQQSAKSLGSAPLPQTPMPLAGSGQAIITDPTHGGQSISPHPPLPPTVGRRTIRALYFPLPRPSIAFPHFTPQIGDLSMASTQHLGEF